MKENEKMKGVIENEGPQSLMVNSERPTLLLGFKIFFMLNRGFEA